MAKRSTQSEQVPTELLKDKAVFKKEIQERITKGEEILNMVVNNSDDFKKMKNEYSSWTDYNNEFLKHAFNNSSNEYRKAYDYAGFGPFGSLSNGQDAITEQRDTIEYKIDNLRKLVAKVDLLKSQYQTPQVTNVADIKVNASEVFIVHGHDDLAKLETARFIERLGFKPIILHEQASSGKTIIEKIEHYSNVGFGIVLYTPCDLGGKKIDSLKSRARQNVVFEHGYLIGKIGRDNVCALVKGDIETPNDISGVVYINMDNSDWQFNIAKELRNSGYKVDMNKL
ncbi:nucleotide-binding protein [Pedobacter sp. CFBP9032]|uniref:nucleotide-binding protein n=1 Tax=Pedobacter sp. CFBP9032 TaxID=3096539 RepID=UPI002A6AAE25|nr:nucleotide-binding protein [Pedobacter sp. CFBP9032]MDY0904072.1 nucleotide-binding protein [Pedobacter sp. CFBP9032]